MQTLWPCHMCTQALCRGLSHLLKQVRTIFVDPICWYCNLSPMCNSVKCWTDLGGSVDFQTFLWSSSKCWQSRVDWRWNAWNALSNRPMEQAMEGTTQLHYNRDSISPLEEVTLPQSLREMTFGNDFDQSLAGLKFPSRLQHLTFGDQFNQSLDQTALPANLRSLTFGVNFNQDLQQIRLPSRLQSLTFGWDFNQSLAFVDLPESLRSLSFGYSFDQSIACLNCPKGLQHLSFGFCFNHPLEGEPFPSILSALAQLPSLLQVVDSKKIAPYWHGLEATNWTRRGSLKTLSFGHDFDQSLDDVIFPKSLQSLTFGVWAKHVGARAGWPCFFVQIVLVALNKIKNQVKTDMHFSISFSQWAPNDFVSFQKIMQLVPHFCVS